MFILKSLMEKRGYKYIKTERAMSNIRDVSFRKIRSLKDFVTIRVDERELEGISNRNVIENYYDGLINKVLNK